MNRLKAILVGVDFTDCSRCALEQTIRLARWNGAALRIIHVMQPPALHTDDGTLQQTLDGLRWRMREDAVARLADWADRAGAPANHSQRGPQWRGAGRHADREPLP